MRGNTRWLAVAAVSVAMLLVLGVMAASVASVSWHVGCVPVWNGETTHIIERTVSVAPGDVLAVSNSVGEIRIQGGGTPGEARVTATVRVWGRDTARSTAEQLLEVRDDGARKSIAFNSEGWRVGFFSVGRGGRADISVVIPDGLDLEVNSSVGRVVLGNVKGRATVESSVGMVSVNGFEGELSAQTQVGAIDVTDALLTGRLTLGSQVGAVKFSGVPGPDSSLRTTTGAITLYLPADRAYTLHLNEQGPGRRFETDLPYTGGRVGSGEPQGTISISTTIGAVHIRAGVK